MKTKFMATAVAVVALGGGLAATAAAAPAASASSSQVVGFNWWHGLNRASHYYASVRPTAFGDKFTAPSYNLTWQSWNRSGAHATGLVTHTSCQPCHVTVVLSHSKLRPRGYGYFFNWETVTYRSGDVVPLRWSFAAGNWVGR